MKYKLGDVLAFKRIVVVMMPPSGKVNKVLLFRFPSNQNSTGIGPYTIKETTGSVLGNIGDFI